MKEESFIEMLKRKEQKGIWPHKGMTGKPETMVGRRFGNLTVINQTDSKNKQNCWTCHCDCGRTTIARTTVLRCGHKKSCGCLHSRPGGKELPFGESLLNHLFSQYCHTAKDRGLIFAIDKKTFRELTKGKCHYCGRPPFNVIRHPKHKGEYVYNGVDRVDSQKGYILDNCVSCCKQCNYAKRDMPKKEFFALIKMIYENWFV